MFRTLKVLMFISTLTLSLKAESSEANSSMLDTAVDKGLEAIDEYGVSAAKSLFSVHASANYKFQYWDPELIFGTEYNTTILSLFQFKASVWHFHFLYETNFGGSPMEKQKELLEKREEFEADKSSLEKVQLDFHNDYLLAKYEQELFLSTVTALEDKIYIDDDFIERIYAGDKIDTQTVFRRAVFGVNFDELGLKKTSDQLRTVPGSTVYMGLFYQDYEKPYAITVKDENAETVSQMSDYIFNAKFSAYGLFIGNRLTEEKAPFNLLFDLYVGYGDIQLYGEQESSFTEIVGYEDERYDLGYFEADVRFGQDYTIWSQLEFDWSLGVIYKKFFLMDSQDESDEGTGITFNEDLIYSANIGLKF